MTAATRAWRRDCAAWPASLRGALPRTPGYSQADNNELVTKFGYARTTVQAGTPMTVAGNDRVARPHVGRATSIIGLKVSWG
jgi:hypothetical protein